MVNSKIPDKTLLALQNEHNKPCISIIVPTHKPGPDLRADQQIMEKAIDATRHHLLFSYGEKIANPLVQKIFELYNEIDFNHNSNGLGLYVSDSIKMTAYFPFSVIEKVIIGESFELRELLYNSNR